MPFSNTNHWYLITLV